MDRANLLASRLSISPKGQSVIGAAVLVLFATAYCWPALTAPFWGDHDAWSNLLPIIHYRDSILNRHTLPLYTDLWYGGRQQWANPLWNFLYLPSTFIWLVTPLDWGTRIVFLGHFIFALLVGRSLASLFLPTELEKVLAAIIFSAPLLPAFAAGHIEKILSWGWILLGIWFLFNDRLSPAQKGIGAGISLGIIPLTGSNYYAMYAGILFLAVGLAQKDRRIILGLLLGSTLGLAHLPSVWNLIGQARANSMQSIGLYSVDLLGIFTSLSTGLARPISWETFAPVGIPVMYLFIVSLVKKTKRGLADRSMASFLPIERALLVSMLILGLLASGAAYRGHEVLNTFRVPARALAFLALTVTIFVLINIGRDSKIADHGKSAAPLLSLSVVQLVMVAGILFRPAGSIHSPYDRAAQSLSETLKADGAKSVWVSTRELGDMYIHANLTENGLGLPNVYYGDMGQKVEITGDNCGYSFDHLIAMAPLESEYVDLQAAMEWSDTEGRVPLRDLTLLQQEKIGNKNYNVYRVACN